MIPVSLLILFALAVIGYRLSKIQRWTYAQASEQLITNDHLARLVELQEQSQRV